MPSEDPAPVSEDPVVVRALAQLCLDSGGLFTGTTAETRARLGKYLPADHPAVLHNSHTTRYTVAARTRLPEEFGVYLTRPTVRGVRSLRVSLQPPR